MSDENVIPLPREEGPVHGLWLPTHAEILAALAAMRPQRADVPVAKATFEELARRIYDAQDGLPLQHCATCGTPYRPQRAGRCWDCTKAARRTEP